MPNTYSLTVVNNSELPAPTFAVFAALPTDADTEPVDLAWLTQQIDSNNQYTFTWEMWWGFGWAAEGAQPGYQWSSSGTLPADPDSPTGCAASFNYDGGFSLEPGNGNPDGSHLTVDDSPEIPTPGQQASSVGVTLGGSPACVLDAGPNQHQVFTLHPTYYIDAGNYVPGQMVDSFEVSGLQQLDYAGGVTALTATLGADNTWSVERSGT
jgi:hypothetical protein